MYNNSFNYVFQSRIYFIEIFILQLIPHSHSAFYIHRSVLTVGESYLI